MPLPRVLEPEVMSGAAEAGEYDDMDFSVTDQLFAEHAAQLSGGANVPVRVIMDLGSGNAKIPLAMCPLLPRGTQVFAIDMSAEMLSIAARNRAAFSPPSAQLCLVNADAKRLPFRDRSAGMVTSNSLIHHIPDPRRVFKEIARIAHPCAPILIRDLVRPENQRALEHLLQTHAARWNRVQRRLFADSLHAAFTLEEVRQMLDDSGLADVNVAQITDRHWSAERASR